MKKQKPQKNETVRKIVNEPPSTTDPQGSWTGKPTEAWETPVQDADNL